MFKYILGLYRFLRALTFYKFCQKKEKDRQGQTQEEDYPPYEYKCSF